MSRSSLSRFPRRGRRAVAERLPDANEPSVRVNELVLILLVRANSGANPNSPWLIQLRAF
jgi:hypothetical protein